MFNRLIELPASSSFFLFGPRGTGKTALLRERFQKTPTLFLDLLDPATFHDLSLNPSSLNDRLAALPPNTRWVIIDEVQKIPALLDVVHQQIEKRRLCFALTGSSARKLKRGGANLLAGRAFLRHLYPMSVMELGARFDLRECLEWGSLPRIFALPAVEDKRDYLRSYAHIYLQEEISQEQLVRKLEPFRRFLFVAAQMSGQIVNFTKIARDCGASVVSVQTYFQILEDTLIGFQLDAFHESIRKRQRANPKFYFFDTGVLRALQNTLTVDLLPHTLAYGMAFEHFVINEIRLRNSYLSRDFRLSYLRTKDDVEIDLILERPGRARALLEIKSTDRVTEDDVRSLQTLAASIPNSECYCLSRDPSPRRLGDVTCLPWHEGIRAVGL